MSVDKSVELSVRSCIAQSSKVGVDPGIFSLYFHFVASTLAVCRGLQTTTGNYFSEVL
jgi:hypothetical protein